MWYNSFFHYIFSVLSQSNVMGNVLHIYSSCTVTRHHTNCKYTFYHYFKTVLDLLIFNRCFKTTHCPLLSMWGRDVVASAIYCHADAWIDTAPSILPHGRCRLAVIMIENLKRITSLLPTLLVISTIDTYCSLYSTKLFYLWPLRWYTRRPSRLQ